MEKKQDIHLSPIEATTYWWINSIRDRIREIAITGTQDEDELNFMEIFYPFTEQDWRNLYLELGKYVSFDVSNYIPRSESYIIDAFSQDTRVNGHDRLNEELSLILNRTIPDIRLASRTLKDSVIYTTNFFANVWYKSCGMTKLPSKYEPSYVLTGDDSFLHFYNLLVATIAVLEKENSNFKSIPILREGFCREFAELPDNEDDIEEVIEMFHSAFNKMGEKGIVLGRVYEKTYFPSFHDIDFVGLEPYMDMAKYYANVILLKEKGGNPTPFWKILKKEEERKIEKK